MTVLKLIYIIAASLLAVYGLQALFLTLIARRTLFDADPTPPPDTEDQPFVTVQLPVFNERHVVRRLIDAVAAFDWPADRLQIQILDDSTDDTSQIIANSVAFHRRNGIDITQIHRTVRTGYKAGALREGLAHARGEFIAIFDADFVPPPDFLQRTISPFDNPEVGCVQARWGHLNANVSRLTLAQSLGIDGHFIVEQRARNDLGALLNFNGTAGLWRRSCMDEA
ncbi:MAG: glycosyltransferase, partial [Caldilineaceae bacterium]|nr:glycosyltransferase [Caldilineaceae bacterium]